MDAEFAVALGHVSKRFGAIRSIEGLSLEVRTGAIFGFLGPNGAGKTTTLRILLGLVHPDRGDIQVLGLDPRVDATRVRSRVGALLETDGLYDRLSAWNNLDYHARIRHIDGKTRRARIEELLRSFDLWERRRDLVVSWSKGMRQKLAIARALLHGPVSCCSTSRSPGSIPPPPPSCAPASCASVARTK